MLHDYTMGRMKELVSEFTLFTALTFVELRNITMVQLTLLNPRCEGEVGRLLIDEWQEAQSDGWSINKD